MSRQKQTKGACVFCGKEMTKGGLTRHFKSCKAYQEAIAKAGTNKNGKINSICHLQVRDAYDSDFWLHLEADGNATLEDLDYYLRAIWLECCHHLSKFCLGDFGGEEFDMHAKIKNIFFEKGLDVTHLYDFGTTSKTIIKLIDVRKGNPLSKNPIFLMARNFMPLCECMDCGKEAKWLCNDCMYEYGETGFLCDDDLKKHEHNQDSNYGGPIRLINSPRVGMCAYCGPALPPY